MHYLTESMGSVQTIMVTPHVATNVFYGGRNFLVNRPRDVVSLNQDDVRPDTKIALQEVGMLRIAGDFEFALPGQENPGQTGPQQNNMLRVHHTQRFRRKRLR